MTLGFIGTGAIAAAMVEGLAPDRILLSPRGASVAADLAARFAGVTIAASNQAVVDGSDLVVLSVRPQVAEAVIRALRFRPGQKVLSLIAATGIDHLQDWIGLDLSPTATASRRSFRPIPMWQRCLTAWAPRSNAKPRPSSMRWPSAQP